MRPLAFVLVAALPLCTTEVESVHPCRGGTATQPLTCSTSADLPGGGVDSPACRTWATRCYADGGLSLSSRQTACGFACADECAARGLSTGAPNYARTGPVLDCIHACVERRRCADGPQP